MRGGPQSIELPSAAPRIRECGSNREGKENNLMTWISTSADLQPDTKHTPGTVEGRRATSRKSCFPHHDPKTHSESVRRRTSFHWPVSTENMTSSHSSPPPHNLNLHCAGRPRLASHIRSNWHNGHKSLRKDCENSVKGHSHALWDFSN